MFTNSPENAETKTVERASTFTSRRREHQLQHANDAWEHGEDAHVRLIVVPHAKSKVKLPYGRPQLSEATGTTSTQTEQQHKMIEEQNEKDERNEIVLH